MKVFPISLAMIDDLKFYEYGDPWLQDLLWNNLNPTQVFQKEGYSKYDMMKYFESLVNAGCYTFFGSKKAGVVLRNYYPNPYVVEPHIVGNGIHIRTLLKVGVDYSFTSTKVTKINIYTHLPSINHICTRLGFSHEGTISKTYLEHGSLRDVFILGISKQDYELTRPIEQVA